MKRICVDEKDTELPQRHAFKLAINIYSETFFIIISKYYIKRQPIPTCSAHKTILLNREPPVKQ